MEPLRPYPQQKEGLDYFAIFGMLLLIGYGTYKLLWAPNTPFKG